MIRNILTGDENSVKSDTAVVSKNEVKKNIVDKTIEILEEVCTITTCPIRLDSLFQQL